MFCSHNVILVFAVLLAHNRSAPAFWLGRVLPRNRYSHENVCSNDKIAATPSIHSTSGDAPQQKDNEATLVLRADYSTGSDPAPKTSVQAMVDFFRDPVNRNCLISGGNKRETQTVATTEELLQTWKARAYSLGAQMPEASDIIVLVRIAGMSFPGIKLTSLSVIGTKLVVPTTSDAFPTYEFVLIQDKREATGLKPLVWIYNQLVGTGKLEREKDTSPTSLSRVTVQSHDGASVVFKIKTFLEIRVRFPTVLLKILPVKKEKAEAQGSSALIKIISKDIDNAITKFRDSYVASLSAI